MDRYLAAIAAIFAALLGGGGIGALLKSRSVNRSLDATTQTKVTEAMQRVYEKITNDLRAEIDRVSEEHRKCRRELDELRRFVYRVEGRVEHLEEQ